MNMIMRDVDGITSLSFAFIYMEFFCTLDWKYNIKPLTEVYKEISNHMMK